MANKALATRQKLRVRVEPSQQAGRGGPRNPFALAARQRVAGPHVKSASALRQAGKRALAKAALKPEKDEP